VTFTSTVPSSSELDLAPQVRQWRFHLFYVAVMAASGLVWLAIPAVALVGFLLLSVHHFGQSDLAHLRIDRWHQLAIQLSRGLFLVGLVLVANLARVGPVIEQMGGFDPRSWSWLAGHTVAWSVALVAQHLAVGLIVAPRLTDRAMIKREVVTVIALTALLIATDPLIGFAVYFGLWHSLNHLNVLADVLGHRAGSAALAPMQLARVAAPRSAVSIAALAVFIVGAQFYGHTELIVLVTLVFVSMLTLPHMIVVERLWQANP
jgi:Brp/Blh family beta-carotene 15,15'-monooxygenase